MTHHGSPPDGRGSPFLIGLQNYAQRGIVRFHTPGHRGGRWLDPYFLEGIGRDTASLDISDLLEGERGPADWSETIRLAEDRAAKIFGAGATRFLVNGTSGGIHASLLAVGMGKCAVYSRASHLSVYGAALLCGAESHYLAPTYDAEWDIPGPPSQEAIREALGSVCPDVAIDTYPNYYGLAHDLGVWGTPEKTGRPPILLTDEAHASHFIVCPEAPPPALSCGAALTVQSFHKTLGSFTQSSVLHVSKQFNHLIPLVDRSLFLLQTTSPSPILLASLEAAVSQLEPMASGADDGWKRAVGLTKRLRSAIEQQTDCKCLDEEIARSVWGAALDPARLVINVARVGWTGIDAARWLRTKKQIQVEMANQMAIVVLISPGNTEDDAERLVEALAGMAAVRPPNVPAAVLPPPWPTLQMDPREAVARPVRWVAIKDAVGWVSSEIVCPYPPGVPVLAPGEKITTDIVEYLRHVRSLGWEVRGASRWDAGEIGVVA